MENTNPGKCLIRYGFVLFALALLSGFVIQEFLNPKMGLAAHLTGILNALVLMAAGLAWGQLSLSPLQGRIVRWSFLYGTYANWLSACLAAAWGTSRLTPQSGSGFAAVAWKETVVQGFQLSLSFAMLAGALLMAYGLRSKPVAGQ